MLTRNSLTLMIVGIIVSIFTLFNNYGSAETLFVQGFLRDINDNPVNKAMKMSFSIHNKHKKLWERVKFVSFDNGSFATTLGKTNPISANDVHSENTLHVGIICNNAQIQSISRHPINTTAISLNQVVIPCIQTQSSSICAVNHDLNNGHATQIVCQGYLEDINKMPVDKTLKMIFSINNTQGVELWKSDKFVTSKNGFFKTTIGKSNPISKRIIVPDNIFQMGILCNDEHVHTIEEYHFSPVNGTRLNNTKLLKNNALNIDSKQKMTGVSGNKKISVPQINQTKDAFTATSNPESCSTIYVPRDYDTIQEAIDASKDCDTVVIMDGIYSGEGNVNIDFQGKAITVTSQNGPENCIIECNDCNNQSVFIFKSGEEPDSVLSKIKIKVKIMNYKDNSIAIVIDHSSPTIEECVLMALVDASFSHHKNKGIELDNDSLPVINKSTITKFSTGIDCGKNGLNSYPIIENTNIQDCGWGINGSNAKIRGCEILNCITGIYMSNIIVENSHIGSSKFQFACCLLGKVVMKDCLIDNSVLGIIFYGGSDTLISNCIIKNNNSMESYSVDENGFKNYFFQSGGVEIKGIKDPSHNKFPTFENCIISENSGVYGGGISLHGAFANFHNCIIQDNQSIVGGGISSIYSTMYINDSFISGNQSDYGGGIYLESSPNIVISDCEITNNLSLYGGGIFNYNASPEIFDCTINNNNGGQYGGGILSVYFSSPLIEKCKIEKNMAKKGSNLFTTNFEKRNPELEIPLIANIQSKSLEKRAKITKGPESVFFNDFLNSYTDAPLKKRKMDKNQHFICMNKVSALNASISTLNILNPTSIAPISIKNNESRQKINIEVTAKAADNSFICDLVINDFNVEIGNKSASILTAVELLDRYQLNVIPPVQKSKGRYDLILSIGNYVVIENNAVKYTDSKQDIDIVLTLDRSGSMAQSGYMEPAKLASCIFIDHIQEDDMIGVVSFSYEPSINYELREIEKLDVKQESQTAVNLLPSFGGTGLGGGLQTAQRQLIVNGSNDHRWYIVLLSDGKENKKPYSEKVIPEIIRSKTKIYSIALGKKSDEKLLQQIAYQTGGKYFYSPDESQLSTIYSSLSGQASNRQLLLSEAAFLDINEICKKTVFIDDSIEDAIFSVSWNDQNNELFLSLIDPKGNMIDEGLSHQDIRFSQSEYSKLFTIKNILPGEWIMQIQGEKIQQKKNNLSSPNDINSTIKYNANITAKSILTLETYLEPIYYTIIDPIHVKISLTDTQPIIGATVIAESNKLSTIEKISLYDDGMHDDGKANDGIYANAFESVTKTGSYPISITATGAKSDGQNYQRLAIIYTYVTKPYLSVNIPDNLRCIDYFTTYEGYISLPHAFSSDLLVHLTSESEGTVDVPPTVILPAGQISARFDFELIDNARNHEIVITASSEGFEDGFDIARYISYEEYVLSISVPEETNEGYKVLHDAGTVSIFDPITSNLNINLTSGYTPTIRVPESVIIQQGETQVHFDITVTGKIDQTKEVEIEASSDGWSSHRDKITILNVYNAEQILYISIPNEANVGDGKFEGVLSIPEAIASDLHVNLASDKPDIVTVNESITLPKGKNSIVFEIIVADTISKSSYVNVEASADGWSSGSDTILVNQNNPSRKMLSLIIPDKATENAGVLTGTVSISEHVSYDLSVNLTSSNTSYVNVPQMVTIEENQSSTNFNINIIDNSNENESKDVTIMAFLEGWVSDSKTIKIIDNENDSDSTPCFISIVNQQYKIIDIGLVLMVLLCIAVKDCFLTENTSTKKNLVQNSKIFRRKFCQYHKGL